MKIKFLAALSGFIFLFGFSSLVNAEVQSSYWKKDKSQHFFIYSQGAENSYITELINNAERYYSSIIENLGYRRFDFWSWDNRAKIYLYPTGQEYLKDTHRAAWSGASVQVKTRTLRTFIGQESFFDSILPHEMTHIIFREFVGEKADLPLWLDEGVAASQEKSTLNKRLELLKGLVRQNMYIELGKLMDIKDYSLVVPQVFYAEAVSLVVFLLDKYGKDRFVNFSRALKDGKKCLQALKDTYRFSDIKELEVKWKEYYSQ